MGRADCKRTNNIIFIAPLSAFRKRTRLAKLVETLLSHDFSVLFFGWEREEGELDAMRWGDARVSEHAILKGGGYVSRKARMMYPLWMFSVFWKVIRLRDRPTVYCLGWETAFPALLASFFNNVQVVFDDADRFSMIFGMPSSLLGVLQYLEKWTSRRVNLHLVPSFSRYDWRHEKMRVFRNSPTEATFNAARLMAPARLNVDLVIYVNGWVGDSRGAPVFLEVMRRFHRDERNIIMHVAGRVDSSEGRELVELPNVIFHGEVSQDLALSLYPACDVVLTFYDPKVRINRLAESNKWGDCIFFNTPFIVNQEVNTAADFLKAGAAWSVLYSDVDALEELLIQLAGAPQSINGAAHSLSEFKSAYPPFNVQVEQLLIGEIL
ncbi:hypothetical protein [Halopseudomonas bauzanensis]|uniref:hypothetical protein n=1 Tax=Halopseudomonas bauzanensis TaxID=653930 RepID=UPI002556B403|nr:hypothetical protein [Halopseudomonas bauzanensis]